MINLVDIINAQKILSGKIRKTPLLPFKFIDRKRDLGFEVYFKAENFQMTGSFKIRGIFNKINSLTKAQIKNGVVAMSVGDHAISLAFVASNLRVPCYIVMPENVGNSNKVLIAKKWGAKIILKKGNLWAECLQIQKSKGCIAIHPFDDPLIIAGHGTIGLEILEDLPQVKIIFVPIGGGGLISGIAIAIKHKKPQVKIVGVEPLGAATMFESMRQNKIIYLRGRKTIANSLAAPYVGKYTFNCVKNYVDEIVLVSDKEIVESFKIILEQSKILTDPAAAASFAAVLFGKSRIPEDSKVVCVLSGGNIGTKELSNLLRRNI